jgi:hypothetical protein
MRERTLPVALVLLVGCDTRPLPAPPEPSASASATASAAPVRSAPFHALSAVIASASAAPSAAPSFTPMPGIPPLERSCSKDDDCGSTFYDQLCCADCMPRLGTKPSVKKIDAFCKENKPKECPKSAPCGYVFGTPRCINGQCAAR